MSDDTNCKPLTVTDLEKFSPSRVGSEGVPQVLDVTGDFAVLSRSAPRDPEFERGFLLRRIQMVRGHPDLHAGHRAVLLESLRTAMPELMEETRELPIPGGVGYGVFYANDFRRSFTTGTGLVMDFIAPTAPGGNVGNYLYLTETNRAAKGVEALILYNGQNELRFRVFDWARSDPWSANIDVGFADLHEMGHLSRKTVGDSDYQILTVQNQTYLVEGNSWANAVWLYNYVKGTWDLVYTYEYSATEDEQKTGWPGSWGPIVETFQNAYSSVNPLGFLQVRLSSRDAGMSWNDWQLLSDAQSAVREDGIGFQMLFLAPNHSFAVH